MRWGIDTEPVWGNGERGEILGWGTDTEPAWDGVESGVLGMGMGNGPWGQEWPGWALQVQPRGGPSSDRVPSGATESQPHPGSGLGSPGCQTRVVSVGGSLCLAPEEPVWEWREIHWKVKIGSGTWQRILTATGDGSVSYPRGSFHGKGKFQPGNFSLCISAVHRADSGVYMAELDNGSVISSQCFRVSVWDPLPPPELKSQILQRDRGWCTLALLCSSPGNVSYSWACPGHPPGDIPEQILEKIPEQIPGQIPEEILEEILEQIPGEIPEQIPGEIPEQIPEQILEEILEQIPGEIPEQIPEQIPVQIPGIPSRLILRLPEGAEPQICLCNVSNPAGWSAARARLTCPGNFSHWTLLAVAVAVAVGLTLLLVGSCCWWRKRRKNSREGTPGAPAGPSELTVYAEVGEKKPRQDPAGTGEATQEGATIYAVVTPRTLEHPRHREEPENFTIYSTVQFGRRPSSIKRKRLDRALVSTAYLEDNGGYRCLGFPNPADHQHP
ncbi:uncharacterized protein LOC120503950 isoform X2 [Passer montanus]|uniref:uncharacterized protein LOC120503950 isoform X2 n=1 Tax=Passer montanus TaxID=9160 RepID=UPI00195F3C81|nr:uncharacterized protein LOC120503950 isoform X2 [Passer montanus]